MLLWAINLSVCHLSPYEFCYGNIQMKYLNSRFTEKCPDSFIFSGGKTFFYKHLNKFQEFKYFECIAKQSFSKFLRENSQAAYGQ